jgi:hypothetical protein
MQYTIFLKAGKKIRQVFEGKTLLVMDMGVAPQLDVLNIEINGYVAEQYRGVKRGFRFRGPLFGAAIFQSPVDAQIEVAVSMADVSVNYQDGNTVNANIVGTVPVAVQGTPLPVSTDRGQNAGAPLFVSGAVLGDTPANNIVDDAGVAVGGAAAVDVLAADATRLEAVFFNQGPDPVALGMLGITWAKRAIVLNAGDTWVESRAAAKRWQAITDATKAATVTVQERKA